MNVATPLKVTKAEFYEFVQQQAEGRFEWERGRIVKDMTGGTFDHIRIAQRFWSALDRQLDADMWIAMIVDRGVDMPETIRYPDVVVEPTGADGKSLATTVPALVVEVLSKSSKQRYLSAKPVEYTSLDSLHAYIVASQDGPECWVWVRGADRRFPADASRIAGRDQVIAVPSLGITLELAEIYRGIGS